jgi:hypothetical protein
MSFYTAQLRRLCVLASRVRGMTVINLLHYSFRPANRIGNGSHGSRDSCCAVVLRELTRCEN